jgi:hypothetical protein
VLRSDLAEVRGEMAGAAAGGGAMRDSSGNSSPLDGDKQDVAGILVELRSAVSPHLTAAAGAAAGVSPPVADLSAAADGRPKRARHSAAAGAPERGKAFRVHAHSGGEGDSTDSSGDGSGPSSRPRASGRPRGAGSTDP